MTKDAFLQFDHAGFSSSDTGTIAFAENFQQEARAKFNVTSGTSVYGGYVGDIDEGDYQLLQNNYGGDPVQRPGALPPMAELYLATLEYPRVYWDIRFVPAIWDWFAEFEAMNLGVIPPPRPDLLARGIPEPGVATVLFALAMVCRRRLDRR